MRAPAGAQQKLLVTKFDFLKFDSLVVSVLCYITLFIISITFIVRNYFSCDLLTTYEGVQYKETDNSYYVIASIHSPKEKQTFSTFFIELWSHSSTTFEITSDILCQWNHAPSAILRQVLPQAKSGKNRVYSTGLFNYDSVLLQIRITGQVSELSNVALTVSHTSPSFFSLENKLTSLFSTICLTTLILYLFAFLFLAHKQKRKTEHYFVIASLFLSIFGIKRPNEENNINDDVILSYLINLLFHGIYQSINFVILFCLIILSTTQESLVVPILLSTLYILASGLNEITQDSAILSTYFDNNDALWVFFMSITIVSQAILLFFGLFRLINEIIQNMCFTKPVVYLLMFLVINQIISVMSMNIFNLVKGYMNSALTFYSRYLSHFITTIILADIYWPTPKGKEVKIRPDLNNVLS